MPIHLSSQGASHDYSHDDSHNDSHEASHKASHYKDIKYMMKERWDKMQYM